MRYLVLTNTPAHVHLYKHAVRELVADGHEVLILARDYGCTVALLDEYGLPYRVYGKCGTTKGSLLKNLPAQFTRILAVARSFDPDLVFGMGTYAAFAGACTRTRTILVLDSEPTGLDHSLSVPVAAAVLTPAAFRNDLGDTHYVFDGFKECAYLHPDVFEPAPDVRRRLGLDPDEQFVVVRFNAFGSHHDVGHGGFSPVDRRRLVSHLAEHATVLVSDEGGDSDLSGLPARRYEAHPALLHDALAAASLLVADTQTMVTEAALLGTPAIRSNSFVGDDDMGNFVELERRGLIRNCRTLDAVCDAADEFLVEPTVVSEWTTRQEEYVRSLVDLTDVITSVAVDPTGLDGVEGLRPRGMGSRRERPLTH